MVHYNWKCKPQLWDMDFISGCRSVPSFEFSLDLDMQLASSLGPFMMTNAAEITRYTSSAWTVTGIKQFENMLTNVFYPRLHSENFCQVNVFDWVPDIGFYQTILVSSIRRTSGQEIRRLWWLLECSQKILQCESESVLFEWVLHIHLTWYVLGTTRQ